MKKLLLYITLLLFAYAANAQDHLLSGRIADAHNQPIPFTSVYIRNSTYGTTANENGRYDLKLSPGTYNVIFRMVGYQEQTTRVIIGSNNVALNVQLSEEIFEHKQVKIVTKRYKDPGMEIMQQVLHKRPYYMQQVKSYSSAVYIKGVQKVFHSPELIAQRSRATNVNGDTTWLRRILRKPKNMARKAFISALDLDSSGRGILYQSESLSKFSFEQPHKVKEETIAYKDAGVNTAFGYSKASDLQVDFYQNVYPINGLSTRGFTSPLGSDAFRYYRFKLAGVSRENGRVIDKIEVLPRKRHGQFFKGDLYIVDGEWRIYSIDLMLNDEMNTLNLVDTLQISQQYVPVTDSVWMPASVQFNFKGSVLGFKFGGYYLGIYNNYKINPDFPPDYFSGELLKVDSAGITRPNSFWEDVRPVPLTIAEVRDYHRSDSVAIIHDSVPYKDSVERAHNRFRPFRYTFWGYSRTSWRKMDELYLTQPYRTVFYNPVEGWGIDLNVTHTKKFTDHRLFEVNPVLHYGFSSKLFSPHIEGSYTYDPEHKGKFYGGFGADVIDLNNVGTRSLWFNTVSSLLYENNYVKYYRSEYVKGGYQRELVNGLVWNVDLSYADRTQLYNTSFNHIFDTKGKEYTSNNPLAPADAPADDRSLLFPHNQALTFHTSLEYTFQQRYLSQPEGKVYLPSKYPVLTLNYRKGIHNVVSSDVDYDFASLDISQYNFRVGLTGYSSFKIAAGDFFNHSQLYFMDYNHFLGNQGTTFDPTYIGSFHYLPFYTFSTNTAFLEAHYQHNFAGSILNKIDFMRRFKLEEVIGVNYLTEKANPNYSEFYIGLKKYFFRVDYGISFTGGKKYLQGFRIYYGIK